MVFYFAAVRATVWEDDGLNTHFDHLGIDTTIYTMVDWIEF